MPERAVATIETIHYDDDFIIDNPELELTLEAEALQITVENMQAQSLELARSGDDSRRERLSRAMAHLSELLFRVREEMSQQGLDFLELESEYTDQVAAEEETLLETHYTPEGIEFLNEVFGDISDLDLDEDDLDGIIAAITLIKNSQRAMSRKSRIKMKNLLLVSEERESVTVKEEAFSYIHRMLQEKFLEQSTIEERKAILRTTVEESRLLPPPDVPVIRKAPVKKDATSLETSWASSEAREYLEKKYHYEDDKHEPLAWQKDAVCTQVDPEVFFPHKGGSTLDAKGVCGTCDVKERCLDYAIQNDERFGVWGGLSERERRRLRRRQSGGA